MKRLFIALVAAALVISACPVYASDMIGSAQKLPGVILELEGYLQAQREDDALLDHYSEQFYDAGGKYGKLLGTYCEALNSIALERYETAIQLATILAKDSSFTDYVTVVLESAYIEDGNALLMYARARKAEAAGEHEAAIELYEGCFSFFDAMTRREKLIQAVCKLKYEAGKAALDRGNYLLAAEYFAYTSQHDYKNSAAL